jgi:hypothetical protein
MTHASSTANSSGATPVWRSFSRALNCLSTYSQGAKDRTRDFAAAHIERDFSYMTVKTGVFYELSSKASDFSGRGSALAEIHPRFYPQAVNR